MNLIRLIKLKLLFGELDELSTSEYDFINMFNNLKKYDRFYITKSDNTIRFKYYEDANVFWYSYDYVGVHFEFFYNYIVFIKIQKKSPEISGDFYKFWLKPKEFSFFINGLKPVSIDTKFC